MLCLRCDAEMQKTIFEGVLVDYCVYCKSFWLDKDEFEHAVQKQEFDCETLVKEAKAERTKELTRKIEWANEGVCPKCMNGKMQAFDMYEVKLDRCDVCGGVFFDKNELKKCYEKATETFFSHMWKHVENFF